MKHNVESKRFLKAVGLQLQSFREAQNKTPESVAKAVNLSPESILSIENGEYDLPLELLIELCEVYDTSPYDFFVIVTQALKG
jgi:DNA-binding XRE family transcriptional regulator